ncbi:MAG: glucuronate isomerase [Bacteroidetes bacterium]|nr:glucuronate isomerase [Bacteroidota bacterium]
MEQTNTMIKPFLGDDFLLENSTAEILYHEYAAKQPIIDYHNHLPPDEIAEDKKFDSITAVWLNGDHYKWRAMRTLGIPEKYITGDASDWEKFQKWAEAVPFTLRNPLYHWTHLELKRYFGVDELLTPNSAKHIFQHCSDLLQTDAYSTRNLLRKMNVETTCSTDDPVDDLRYHQQVKQEGMDINLFPAFRPDKAILIEKETFPEYIQRLGEVAGVDIHHFEDILQALKNRMDFFHENGCRISDHGLEQVYAANFTDIEVNTIFKKRMSGLPLEPDEKQKYMSAMLYHLGCQYAERGWVQQFHLGALRNNNSRLLHQLGPDTGFDSIGDWEQAASLSKFLNRLDSEDKLAKTILYNLNPRDNEVMATMVGNFNDGSTKGKMQFGSAWWFLDQKDGMEKQISALSNMGLLSCFIGMLTDSRSFLSFPRHEYFRRLLCNLIGRDVHNGELPNDTKWLGGVVEDICYRNAKNYFNF